MDLLPASQQVLEPAEAQLVEQIWRRLSDPTNLGGAEGQTHLRRGLEQLFKLWEAVQVHPSVLRKQTLGSRYRDIHSLVETLSTCHPYSTEVFVPTRGVLCRAFLYAKLNFCRLLGVILTESLANDGLGAHLRETLTRIQTTAVCNLIAEDLLRMIASDQTIDDELRQRAALVLVQMWEYRACRVVPRFFPVLDSVWQAKAHVVVSYGTLSGVSELLSMLSKGCDPLFVECFSQDEVSDDEEYALQEFVFNFSYEQLQTIQQDMEVSGSTSVDASRVASIIHVPVQALHVQTCTCEEMIFTFRERESLAEHRRAFNLPGPKRTAEQYLMTYLLQKTSTKELNNCDELT
jgi:hypothetical protein